MHWVYPQFSFFVFSPPPAIATATAAIPAAAILWVARHAVGARPMYCACEPGCTPSIGRTPNEGFVVVYAFFWYTFFIASRDIMRFAMRVGNGIYPFSYRTYFELLEYSKLALFTFHVPVWPRGETVEFSPVH